MKLLPVLIILGMASIDLVSAENTYTMHWPPQECQDLCKKAYPEYHSQCLRVCSLCFPGLSTGYLPKTLYEVPPDCPSVCKQKGKDKSCIPQCSGFQSFCCHSVFGCCPHDARVCV
ncbi:hypothetical protein V8E36_008882 [Tilletia maclaganii]